MNNDVIYNKLYDVTITVKINTIRLFYSQVMIPQIQLVTIYHILFEVNVIHFKI
jgi:hypothetical protein